MDERPERFMTDKLTFSKVQGTTSSIKRVQEKVAPELMTIGVLWEGIAPMYAGEAVGYEVTGRQVWGDGYKNV